MKRGWLWAWLAQAAVMLAVGALAAATAGVGGPVYGLAVWGLAPAAGLLTACLAVRRGLNNYLAWLAPAPCLWASSLLIWGYSPPAGPTLLTAFTSLVGAAAGFVIVQRSTDRRSGTRGRR